MTVRSAQLAIGTLNTASITTVYSVPVGRRTIVKSIFVLNGQPTTENESRMYVTSGGTLRTVHAFSSLPQNKSEYFECWFVLDTGDSLQLSFSQGGARYLISGAELVE